MGWFFPVTNYITFKLFPIFPQALFRTDLEVSDEKKKGGNRKCKQEKTTQGRRMLKESKGKRHLIEGRERKISERSEFIIEL